MPSPKPAAGSPANLEALTAFLEKRKPDFTQIPGE